MLDWWIDFSCKVQSRYIAWRLTLEQRWDTKLPFEPEIGLKDEREEREGGSVHQLWGAKKN